tara:strand:- start:335 stop:655 length:321 start_codon:yes stop_codon:yes gene_type:complete
LKIIYTKVKFHPSKSLYKYYFPEDKTQIKLQNWAKLKKNIPTLSERCINSGLSKRVFDNFHRIKIFNLSEKKPFYDFSMETIKVCYVKPYKSSYHWKVDVPATPTQ